MLINEIITPLFIVLMCGSCLCYAEENNFCLKDESVVHRVNHVSFETCQEECRKRSHCKAFNYRRSFQLCELLGVEQGEQVSSPGDKKHCLFFRKSEMFNKTVSCLPFNNL